MATITLKGNPIHTSGDLPTQGNAAPDFQLLRADLSRASLSSFSGKKILNIFPSIDTPVCAISVRKFNKLASEKGVTVLNISEDLPFAQKRFCGAEGIDKCESLSAFRSSFGKDYGVEITDGPLRGPHGARRGGPRRRQQGPARRARPRDRAGAELRRRDRRPRLIHASSRSPRPAPPPAFLSRH